MGLTPARARPRAGPSRPPAPASLLCARSARPSASTPRGALGPGSPPHRFLDGLDKTYGSRDGSVGAGASFAIESWAAFGIGHGPAREKGNFWRQLLDGLEGFNRRRKAAGQEPLPLGFFRYHFQLESGHGAGVWKELSETFGTPDFDPAKFLAGGRRALAAINAFWLGLDEARLRRENREERCLAGINVGQWAV